MKFASAVLLLIIATVFLTFTVLSFSLFPRLLSLDSASLLMQTIFIAGLSFMMISLRQLRRHTIKLKVVKRKD
jgi:hypothetical protein